ncbi:hypothetical protein HYPSUDRAFT_45225 [Hypholoma sublateritium FD-334 SS-4]|uniref:DUF6699 domain-containing protein n=1 Tax=Hypholoma sublateritium (strain FD-334 SS-4) TaxID=945553 RepID=A0A0D2NP01_HYPSF|nr:hypothetical protein HYPSUDRAFT_45225 [Hypholoma sublateritium FD-334 SS-4]
MPGKHFYSDSVPRFAPSSSTPSSTASPELGFGSPYHTIPLPGMPPSLHPVLTVQPTPTVDYDLSLALDTMRLFTYPIPTNFWEQQASLPPVPFLKVSYPGSSWHVTVSPSSKSATGVTVGDVFLAIYRSLRTSVSKQEFASASSDVRKAATEAYYSRIARVNPSWRAFERGKGLKRIDFLGKHRHFAGIVPVWGNPGGWMLIVG